MSKRKRLFLLLVFCVVFLCVSWYQLSRQQLGTAQREEVKTPITCQNYEKNLASHRPGLSRILHHTSALATFTTSLARTGTRLPFFILDREALRSCFGDRSNERDKCASGTGRVVLAAFEDSYDCIILAAKVFEKAGWYLNTSARSVITFTSKRLRVDVRIITQRHRYWYLPAVDQIHHAEAFLPFNLTVTSLNSFRWLIPHVLNMTNFLQFSLNYSRFIPRQCDEPPSTEPTVITMEQFERLAVFRDFLLERGVAPFLFGGTALGWYRNCGLIPDTTDLDLCAVIGQYNDRVEKDLIAENVTFSLYWILGKRDDSLELSVMSRGVKIDLFFLFESAADNKSWVGGMIPTNKAKLRWVYPMLNNQLCSADLLGHLFLVPCDPEAFIRADYGPNWRVPQRDANFVWSDSHHNVERRGHWTPAEWPTVYRTFSFF